MDVICERCRTEYEFDDTRLTDEGVTVKCSTCGHLFRVRRSSRAAAELPPEAAVAPAPTELSVGAASEPGDAGETRDWMVRTASSDVLYFKNLGTLRKWIGDKRVSRDDEISKSGDAWKRLGDIVELEGFFAESEAAASAASAATAASAAAQGTAAGPAARAVLASQVPEDAPVPTAVTRTPGPLDDEPTGAESHPTMLGRGGADAEVTAAGPAPTAPSAEVTVAGPAPRPAAAVAAPAPGAQSGPRREPAAAAPSASPAPNLSVPPAPTPAGPRREAAVPTLQMPGPASSSRPESAGAPMPSAGVPAPRPEPAPRPAAAARAAAPAPAAPRGEIRIETAPRAPAVAEEPKIQISPELLAEREPAWASLPSRSPQPDAHAVPTDVVRVPDALRESGAADRMRGTFGADVPTPFPGSMQPLRAANAAEVGETIPPSRGLVHESSDPDEELAALEATTRGRGGRVVAGLFITAVGLGLGVLGFRIAAPESFASVHAALFGDGPSASAQAALDAGRAGLRRDSRQALADAQGSLERAIQAEGGGGWPAAEGLLAQVHVAQARIAAEEADAARTHVHEADAAEISRRVQRLGDEARNHEGIARDVARRVTAADPKALDAWVALAELAVLARDREAFNQAVQTASALGRDDAGVLHVRGAAALGLAGTVEDALFYLKRAVQADPERLRARFDLARAYAARKEIDEARAALTEVLRANPEHERAVDLNGELAKLAAAGGAAAGASGVAGSAGASGATGVAGASGGKPVFGAALVQQAAAQAAAGAGGAGTSGPAGVSAAAAANPGAGASAPAAAGHAPSLEESLREADKLRARGNCTAAMSAYERAHVTAPGDARPLVGAGWCDLDSKQFERGLGEFRRALAVSPDLPDALMGVAEANRLQGNSAEALRWYERYLKVAPNGPEAAVARQNLANGAR